MYVNLSSIVLLLKYLHLCKCFYLIFSNNILIWIGLLAIWLLLPFDKNQDIVKSIQKTNRLIIIDEDVPGGASAYLLSEILEKQDAFQYLDSKPVTLTAKDHRPAYGTDGDYFSKPSAEDIFETIYKSIFNW